MIRDIINIPMNGMEQAEYDREIANLRAGMDENSFKNAWAEGRALTMEEAIDYALI